jgi:hypothetical protein
MARAASDNRLRLPKNRCRTQSHPRHVSYGSLAASPVARWRGSYAPDIGLEGLTTGAAEMGISGSRIRIDALIACGFSPTINIKISAIEVSSSAQ